MKDIIKEEIKMNKLDLYVELTAIAVMTNKLNERTRLISLLVDKYQYRDDIEAECILHGIEIELEAIKNTMTHMNERTLMIQEMLKIME